MEWSGLRREVVVGAKKKPGLAGLSSAEERTRKIAYSSGKTEGFEQGDVESDVTRAVNLTTDDQSDVALRLVCEAWPHLGDHERTAVLTVVRAAVVRLASEGCLIAPK